MAGGGGALGVERSKRGKSSRKKKKRVSFSLDMTPLVDITFLLLTFFMFTTTMAQPQIMEMSMPPEINEDVEVKASELMTILVGPESELFWYIGDEPAQEAELDEIAKIAVRENLKPNVKNRLITALKASEEAPYGLVVNVLDELNLAELAITEEISSEVDEEGKPKRRERRFTIAELTELELEKIEEAKQ